MSALRARLPYYIQIAWGLFVVFGLLGTCAKPNSQAPITILIFVSLAWVLLRISMDAIAAWMVLQAANSHAEKLKGDGKGGPSRPT